MEKRIIIEGEMIHHVGYRPFLLTAAFKLKKITNFEAENILEGEKQKVTIYMIGEEQSLLKFVEFVKNNFPDYAKNCRVISEEDKITTEVMGIYDFRDVLDVEQQNNIVQGGLQISGKIDNLGINLGNKIDMLRKETNNNFDGMNEKYKLISEGMFSVVNELKETNKELGNRLEKTEKNIEKLLEILILQKKEYISENSE